MPSNGNIEQQCLWSMSLGWCISGNSITQCNSDNYCLATVVLKCPADYGTTVISQNRFLSERRGVYVVEGSTFPRFPFDCDLIAELHSCSEAEKDWWPTNPPQTQQLHTYDSYSPGEWTSNVPENAATRYIFYYTGVLIDQFFFSFCCFKLKILNNKNHRCSDFQPHLNWPHFRNYWDFWISGFIQGLCVKCTLSDMHTYICRIDRSFIDRPSYKWPLRYWSVERTSK